MRYKAYINLKESKISNFKFLRKIIFFRILYFYSPIIDSKIIMEFVLFYYNSKSIIINVSARWRLFKYVLLKE